MGSNALGQKEYLIVVWWDRTQARVQYLNALCVCDVRNHELEDIVERKWAQGDYSVLYPRINKFPVGGLVYCMKQAIAIRKRETELGLADHASFEVQDVLNRITSEVEKQRQQTSEYTSAP